MCLPPAILNPAPAVHPVAVADKISIVIAGGGAAGFFAAIACAEKNPNASVILLEKSPELLSKVTISGGGRCNVTHACFDPKKLVTYYPRGGRELLGPFHRWQPQDTVDWFESRDVPLKAEEDGRMFPTTDKSTTITSCLLQEAEKKGVQILRKHGLASAEKTETGFHLTLTTGEMIACHRLLIATGGNQGSKGFEIAESLGHTILPLVPSLFTFHIDDPRLEGLSGISVADADVSVPSAKLSQRGPLLVTHWGLSGPAVLKLSAWGARSLFDMDYVFELSINWLPPLSREKLTKELQAFRAELARKAVTVWSPFGLPLRLWKSLTHAAGIADALVWSKLSNESLAQLVSQLHEGRFQVRGKSLFKEEFVTCGGVALNEVDFRTMESKVCKGLYFAGEILDIDGVTGGFNLQAAWTTGWIAGNAMGEQK